MMEELSDEDAELRDKILKIFQVIKTTENPDRDMLDEKDRSFLEQDFDVMPFDQLCNVYLKYEREKDLNKVIHGTSKRYNMLKGFVHQFARGVLEYDGDPNIFTGHLDAMRHESTIKAIAESTRHKPVKVSKWDNFLGFAGPIGTTMWAWYNHKQRKLKHEEKMNTEMSIAEADLILDRIDDL
jgi:hypothetical protein